MSRNYEGQLSQDSGKQSKVYSKQVHIESKTTTKKMTERAFLKISVKSHAKGPETSKSTHIKDQSL